jgi:cysteine desulfurase
MTVYADNAATTRISRAVLDAMLPYYEEFFANPSSIHSYGRKAADAVYRARETLARNLNCTSSELYFTSGGSEANNQAILTAAEIGASQNKRHIISSQIEHPSVLNMLKRLAMQGFEVTLIGAGKSGIVSPGDVERAVRSDTCLVSIMAANNEIGTIQPIAEIGKICKEKGVLFHTDAVQAAGYLEISPAALNTDLLSLSAHKFYGPKGIGLLYARKGITPSSVIIGGAQERRRRAGTLNVPAIVGMAAAFDEVCRNMAEDNAKIARLRDKITGGLLEIPGSHLNGDKVNRLPGNINISFAGISGESLLLALDACGIMVSTGSACEAGAVEVSHVLLALGKSQEQARDAVRISLDRFNTEAEVDYIIECTAKCVERLRAVSGLF